MEVLLIQREKDYDLECVFCWEGEYPFIVEQEGFAYGICLKCYRKIEGVVSGEEITQTFKSVEQIVEKNVKNLEKIKELEKELVGGEK